MGFSIILFVLETILLSIIQGMNVANQPMSRGFAISSMIIMISATLLSIVMIIINAKNIKDYYHSKAKSIVGVAFASLSSFIGILFCIGLIIGFSAA